MFFYILVKIYVLEDFLWKQEEKLGFGWLNDFNNIESGEEKGTAIFMDMNAIHILLHLLVSVCFSIVESITCNPMKKEWLVCL